MQTKETYQERYNRAKARVDEIRSFYNHLIVYIVVNCAIAGFNFYIDEWHHPWFLFPLAGWGIGLVSHALGTFNINPFINKEWEQRKIQQIMEQETEIKN